MRAPARRVGLCLTVGVVALACLVAPESRAAISHRTLSGFRIEAGPRAMHNWIGSYRIGNAAGFQFQPARRAVATSYQPPRLARHLGKHTHQVAYLLSEYGARRDRIQAAAVDAAVLALSRGGRFDLNGSVGSRRIRQVGSYAGWVRSYARQMIADARRHAGPYRVQVRVADSTAGAATPVQVRVRSASGAPMAGRRVTVRLHGATWTGYTTAKGVAATTMATPTAGAARVVVGVSQMPTAGVVVRRATNRRSSGLLVAGRFGVVRASARFAVSGGQSLVVSTTTSADLLPASVGGAFTISGGAGDRVASVGLIGPVDQAGPCVQTPSAVTDLPVAGDGNYSLTEVPVTTSGFYRWRISVSGNEFSDPVTACGEPVVVRSQGRVTQARSAADKTTVEVGKPFRIVVSVAGFDRTEAHTVRSVLHGPFATSALATCEPESEARGTAQTRTVTTNQTRNQGQVVISNPDRLGWYIWQSTLSDGLFIAGATSSCGARFHVVG